MRKFAGFAAYPCRSGAVMVGVRTTVKLTGKDRVVLERVFEMRMHKRVFVRITPRRRGWNSVRITLHVPSIPSGRRATSLLCDALEVLTGTRPILRELRDVEAVKDALT